MPQSRPMAPRIAADLRLKVRQQPLVALAITVGIGLIPRGIAA